MARRVFLSSLVLLFCVLIVAAQFRSNRPIGRTEGAAELPLARLQVDSGLVRFEPLDPQQFYVLKVSGRDGYGSRTEFFPDEAILFPLVDEDGNALPDGSYSYQLRMLTDPLGEGTGERESSPWRQRTRDDEPGSLMQTGSFEIIGGVPSVPEPSDATPMADEVFGPNHIVRGNACIGSACLDGESFPKPAVDSVLKVKGYEPTILLEGSSDNDWQVTSNDENSGEFAITQYTGSSQVDQLTIQYGARDNSVFVDSSGNVGLGTIPDPGSELHVLSTGDEANLQLEHGASGKSFSLSHHLNNSSNVLSFDGQVPDILRLAWDSPQYSLVVDAGGLGVGTDTPSAPLHVQTDIASGTQLTVADTVDGGYFSVIDGKPDAYFPLFWFSGKGVNGNGGGFVSELPTANDVLSGNEKAALVIEGRRSDGTNLVNTNLLAVRNKWTPAMWLTASGNLYTTGSITPGSSRELKEQIESLELEEASEALAALDPVTFLYKGDQEKDLKLGFIAEDVPELLATPDRKGVSSMDVVAVLTRVLQDQQKLLQDQKKVLEEQQGEISGLKDELAEIRARLGDR